MADEIVARDGGERLERAAHGEAVGVAREGRFAPCRARASASGSLASRRKPAVDLGPHALDRVGVEARLVTASRSRSKAAST